MRGNFFVRIVLNYDYYLSLPKKTSHTILLFPCWQGLQLLSENAGIISKLLKMYVLFFVCVFISFEQIRHFLSPPLLLGLSFWAEPGLLLRPEASKTAPPEEGGDQAARPKRRRRGSGRSSTSGSSTHPKEGRQWQPPLYFNTPYFTLF